MIAQFRSEKAHADLIDAVKLVLDAGIDVNVLLVGAGNLQEEIRNHVVELDMSKHVIFSGMMDDVRPALAAADVLCINVTRSGNILECRA